MKLIWLELKACSRISLNYATVKYSHPCWFMVWRGCRDPFEIYCVIDLWLSCLKFFLLFQGLWLLKTVCELTLHPGLDHRKLLAELLGRYYLCIGKEQSNAPIIHGLVDHTVGGTCSLKYCSDRRRAGRIILEDHGRAGLRTLAHSDLIWE